MDVFVGNLHDAVAYRDVALLFRDFKQPPVNLVVRTQADSSAVRYAVVTFDSDRLAKKAISKFDGHTLRGQPIIVREFVHRGYANERRALDWRSRAWSEPERRQSDRRKGQRKQAPGVPVNVPSPSAPADKATLSGVYIEGYRDFARKH